MSRSHADNVGCYELGNRAATELVDHLERVANPWPCQAGPSMKYVETLKLSHHYNEVLEPYGQAHAGRAFWPRLSSAKARALLGPTKSVMTSPRAIAA